MGLISDNTAKEERAALMLTSASLILHAKLCATRPTLLETLRVALQRVAAGTKEETAANLVRLEV